MRPQPLICVYVSDQVREVERLHRDLLTDGVRSFPFVTNSTGRRIELSKVTRLATVR